MYTLRRKEIKKQKECPQSKRGLGINEIENKETIEKNNTAKLVYLFF